MAIHQRAQNKKITFGFVLIRKLTGPYFALKGVKVYFVVLLSFDGKKSNKCQIFLGNYLSYCVE